MWCCLVTRGVDIGATCQHKAVEAPNERVESRFALYVDREDDRVRARFDERSHVVGRHQRGLRVPRAPRRFLVVSGDPDDGAFAAPGARQSGVTYAALMPPSTRKVLAVMKEASSDARKQAAAAISSGSAKRPIGMCTSRCAARSASLADGLALGRWRLSHEHQGELLGGGADCGLSVSGDDVDQPRWSCDDSCRRGAAQGLLDSR